MNHKILEEAALLQPQFIQDRRYLHQNPELSFQETGTEAYICRRLDQLGISYRAHIAGTGVVAEIRGQGPGPCLLIRADMDALPLQEETKAAYGSKRPGVMHACGHDAHTGILLGTCELLKNHSDEFRGTVKALFQPGEETTGGAQPMIEAGVLAAPAVDACVALHADPELEAGWMRVKPGPMYASPDDFAITIHGRGGHGAEPHLAVDPIVVAAQIINQLQTIVSRSIDPFEEAVVTIGAIHAGDATNVIPDQAQLLGTARSLTEEMREHLAARIEQIVKTVCDCYGASYDYQFIKLFPPLCNDPRIAKGLLESGIRCLGQARCVWGGRPTMAGEDFSYFSQKVPSALFKLGCGNRQAGITAPLHNSRFDLDEGCMPLGAAIFTDFALRFLGHQQG